MWMDRAAFLKLAGAGLVTAGGCGGLAATAGAVTPPAPKEDDIGYVQWGYLAELVSIEFYKRALKDGDFTRVQRRPLDRSLAGDRQHFVRLRRVLGTEAPVLTDYEVVFPDRAFASVERIVREGERIESMIGRVYLNGVTLARDSGTRDLLGRLLVSDTEHLSALRELVGEPAARSGLIASTDLEPAGVFLDRYLRQPGVPEDQ